MGSKQKIIIWGSWLIALSSLVSWSTSECLVAFWATARHKAIPKVKAALQEPDLTDFRRSEQKYFLDYGIYIPLPDIMFTAQLPLGGARYANALKRSCSGVQTGNGVAIWLPLKIKLPLVGERVFEWCWKPPVHRKT
jgi:hypothetical protein